MNNDDWTEDEIALAAERQAEINATTERNKALAAARQAEITPQQDDALLEQKKTNKPSFVYIVIRLLIGLIPAYVMLSFWHRSSGFEVIADYIRLFGILLLSFGFYGCYLAFWVSKVKLIPSIFYSACIVGSVVLLLVMIQS
ncbi:MAG: hypothetical protein WAW36_12885 [Methylovulum miyakonense]|uniref:hypothetical protein n=1 Tax=Methylovulum miyakonense TaxID=645578 RepID=UPI003BB498CE